MSTAISFEGVSKRFRLHQNRPRTFQEKFVSFFQRNDRNVPQDDDFWALQDVSFDIEQGQTVGLIGPNGSGKSTALKLIARILEPSSGQITVNGRVSALLELGAGFHPDLTGRENVYLNGALLGLDRNEVEQHFEEIVQFAELDNFIDVPVKHYSSGMYVRLGFAVAVHLDPEILLIDEVLAVGDQSFQSKCMDRIAALRRHGVTIVFVSHALDSVQSLCETAIWFEHGEIQSAGPPTDVIMSYLGRVAKHADQNTGKARLNGEEEEYRWGSKRILITDVDLIDDKGESHSVFHTGEPFGIHMRYKTEERVQNPVFGIAIHHQNGTHICGPNTKFNDQQISEIHGTGEVYFRIDSLPLLQGTYEVSVAVTNQSDTEIFDYHDRLYPFRVYPGSSQEKYGLITLGGVWDVRQHDSDYPPLRQKIVTGTHQ